MRALLLTIALIFSMASLASAHEFLLKPAKSTVAAGENLNLQAQAAHVFMISEEAENPAHTKAALLQDGKNIDIPLKEDPSVNSLVGQVTILSGNPAMLVGHRIPQIWSDTTEGVLEGDRAALEAKGKKVLKVGEYEKFAKTLLNGNAQDTSFKQQLNQKLEIIPMSNPATLKAGDSFDCLILLNGKPLAQANLGVTYDGFSPEGDAYVAKTISNEQGIAKATITTPGLWMLRTDFTGPIKSPVAEKQNLRATYVFNVN